MKTKNICLGETFEDFLKEEGIYQEVHTKALKKTLAYELQDILSNSGITQTELAKKMGTSRAVIQRLLNPENTSVTLFTLDRVSQVLGKKLRISFE